MEITRCSVLAIFCICSASIVAAQNYKQLLFGSISINASAGSIISRIQPSEDDLDITDKMRNLIQAFNETVGVRLNPLRLEDLNQKLDKYGLGSGSIRFNNVTITGLLGIVIEKVIVDSKTKSITCAMSVPALKIDGRLYTDGYSFPPRVLIRLSNLQLKATTDIQIVKNPHNDSEVFQLTGMNIIVNAEKLAIKCSDIIIFAMQSVDVNNMKKSVLTQIIKIIITEVNKHLKNISTSDFQTLLNEEVIKITK